MPVVRFDGTNDFLLSSTGARTGNQPHTLIAVIKQTSGSFKGAVAYGTEGAGNSTSILGNNASNLWYGGQNLVPPAGSSGVTSGFAVVSKTYDGATTQGYLNGSADGSSASQTYNIGNTQLGLGLYYYNSSIPQGFGFCACDIGEICFYEKFLTADERASVERYLLTRWSIA